MPGISSTPNSPSSAPQGQPVGSSRLRGEDSSIWRGRARRDQLLSCAVGVALLAGAITVQTSLAARRLKLVQEPETSLQSLAVTFPRLTLGGFRGLLATYLWYQAEDDKNDKKWMDLETKYDIIGALEPYFVTVYVFHSWNQAYNLSAQWHDQDTKYKWVLDGLAYLYKGEEYNPGNPDLILEQSQLYFLKLGGAFERIFFRAHWRTDVARLHAVDAATATDTSTSTEALKLVRQFVNRPEFHVTELRQGGAPGYGVSITDAELFNQRKDGKAVGDPVEFPYGLSPFYFAFAEYRKCLASGMPTTQGINIVDGWPGMSLRMWCRDDLYYAQKEIDGLFDTGTLSEVLSDDKKLNAKIAELRVCYRNVDMIAPKAVEYLQADMAKYPSNRATHENHVLETQSYQAIGAAEGKLLDALVLWQTAGRKMTPEVKSALANTLPVYDTAIAAVLKWCDKMYPLIQGKYVNPDRADFERYANAMRDRKAGIEAMLTAAPTDPVNMTFLQEDVVEK